jgi:dUTP pyrophosphatase
MLNKQEIKALIDEKKLVSDYIDLDVQLTPNGFDLSAAKIFKFIGRGALDFSNRERLLPESEEIPAQKQKKDERWGWWELTAGTYKVRTNETVTLPNNLIALCYSRTSLLRMGAYTQHGVWDAGFSGKGEFILVVGSSAGIRLKQNARIAQLVFFPTEETEGYNGIYQEK